MPADRRSRPEPKRSDTVMKILHILNDGDEPLYTEVIDAMAQEDRREIIDLSKTNLSYDEIIDLIFDSDKVISWQ
mgnify:CR=1 FL=1|jgi:hypothetical protein